MIIHNDVHQRLVDTSEQQGWNEESQILHLCGFINHLKKNADIPADFDAEKQFYAYIQAVADEENESIEATHQIIFPTSQ